jgi:radical SAM superfamily enzyme YgiQ (UPF0313 family)
MGFKVFLGNAPWHKPGYYGVRAGSRWPHFESELERYMPFPFQLAYAAALLEQHQFDVLLVDGIAEKMTEEAFIHRIEQMAPDLILLEVSTPSFGVDIRFARRLRSTVANGAPIAFCGPHAPMFSSLFLQSHTDVDMVLTGEYENTLLSVAHALAAGRPLNPIKGLIFRDRDGIVVSTGTPEFIENIDDMPWPARHFLPMQRYFDQPGDLPGPSLQMWASRGCPYACSYCIWPQVMNGNTYRPRSVTAILDEMEKECARFDLTSVYFDDDTFNIGKARMISFCKEKISRGIHLPWAIMARADTMDRDILEAMAQAGLWAVKYGVESAEPKLLTHVGKKLDLRKAVENIQITHRLGIKTHLTFMFGIPGETRESIRRTVALAKKLNPDSVQFSILTLMTGTRIYDELQSSGHLMNSGWEEYDGYFSAVIRTDELSAGDLEDAVRWAWQQWYRHRMLKNLSWQDIARMARSLPTYLRNPGAAVQQLKRLWHD